MSYFDIRVMPVYYRQWFVKRIIKDIEKNNKEKQNDSSNMNSLAQYEKFISEKNK